MFVVPGGTRIEPVDIPENGQHLAVGDPYRGHQHGSGGRRDPQRDSDTGQGKQEPGIGPPVARDVVENDWSGPAAAPDRDPLVGQPPSIQPLPVPVA